MTPKADVRAIGKTQPVAACRAMAKRAYMDDLLARRTYQRFLGWALDA